MVLSESISDHFLKHTKRTQPTAAREKPAKRSAKEASAYSLTKTPSDRVQQTNSPGESKEIFQRMPGCTGAVEDALHNEVASMPQETSYVSTQYQLADVS